MAHCPALATGARPPRAEFGDVFRARGERYRRTHKLSRTQLRAMRAIERCRTAALGGHRRICDTCHAVLTAYNSCRNRHCPKCQALARERWLEARRAEILPVEYFHVVFTLPHDLNPLAQGNPRAIYSLLFSAVAATLTAFASDPKHLGGECAITAILHTWGQNLSQHLHLHCLVPGGALAAGGTRWIRARPGFLFPVRALSKVFRGKFLDALTRAFEDQQLTLAGAQAHLADPSDFARFVKTLCQRDWVVYAKPPLAGPRQVLDYLARYTHRVAISNDRLLAFDGSRVRFRWKDYADHSKLEVMDLDADEFIRRFLLHVLPPAFVRIRHYGILANRGRSRKLARCRALLGQPPPPPPDRSGTLRDRMLRVTGLDIDLCPLCRRGRLVQVQILEPVPAWDTS